MLGCTFSPRGGKGAEKKSNLCQLPLLYCLYFCSVLLKNNGSYFVYEDDIGLSWWLRSLIRTVFIYYRDDMVIR